MTQLGEVNETTGKGYVRELYTKYQPGRTIADVPSAPEGLAGRTLSGDMVLEVPVQTSAVPQSVLDLAKELNIMIRDINGTVYGG
jgi:filamentous hemagglutinin